MAYPTEQPGVIFSVSDIAADLAINRFVDEDGNYTGVGEKAAGVTTRVANEEGIASYMVTGVKTVEAASAIAKGDLVTSAANGKAMKLYPNTQVKYKDSDTTKATDTTYADDPDLAGFEVGPSLKYRVRGVIHVANAKAGAQTIKFKFTAPTSATMVGSILFADAIGNPADLIDHDANLAAEVTQALVTSETGTIYIDAILTTSTAAGVLDLQWAQNASDADGITLEANSYIDVQKVTEEHANGFALTAASADKDKVLIVLK